MNCIMNYKINATILYIGGLTYGTTGYRKFLDFNKLVKKVHFIDTDKFKRRKNLVTYLNNKEILKNVKIELNSYICNYVKGKQFDLIYFSKATWIFPETLIHLKNHSSLLVHYTPDAAFKFNFTRDFGKGVKYYDILLTTKEWELKDYYSFMRNNKVYLVNQGVDTDFFKPNENNAISSDLLFIGRKEKHYSQTVDFIYNQNIDIHVYGNQWCKSRKYLMSKKKPYVKGPNLNGIDYVNMINSTKIGLGLLSKLFPETSTTRTFEIAACGTFLLAERTKRHQELFEENKEAVFFSSKEELISKAQYYLNNDKLRNEIARNGRLRCINSNYSNLDIIKYILSFIKSN